LNLLSKKFQIIIIITVNLQIWTSPVLDSGYFLNEALVQFEVVVFLIKSIFDNIINYTILNINVHLKRVLNVKFVLNILSSTYNSSL